MRSLGRTLCWITAPQKYLVLCLVAILFLFPFLVRSGYYIQVMIMIIYFAYLSSCWNILAGYAGQLSIGNAAFVLIGAYIPTLLSLNLGLTPWIGMLIGGLVAAFLGFIVGYPTFRLRGAYFAISTMVLAEGLMRVVENIEYIGKVQIGGAEGLCLPMYHNSPFQFQFVDKNYYYYIILIMMLAVVYITYRIDRSKMGYYLWAIREDEDAAEALGVDVRKYKLLACIVSGFFTALAGTFYAQLMLYFDPVGVGGVSLSIEMVLIGVIGGRGTIIGPIIGAFLLIPIREMSRLYVGTTFLGAHLVIAGSILVIVILFFPHGVELPIMKLFNRICERLECRKVVGRSE